MLPLDCQQGGRFEFALMLSFEYLVFFGNRRSCRDVHQVTRVACTRMPGVLRSRQARDHRAARNQAAWQTEAGRLNQACGGSQQKNFPYYTQRPFLGKTSTSFFGSPSSTYRTTPS